MHHNIASLHSIWLQIASHNDIYFRALSNGDGANNRHNCVLKSNRTPAANQRYVNTWQMGDITLAKNYSNQLTYKGNVSY